MKGVFASRPRSYMLGRDALLPPLPARIATNAAGRGVRLAAGSRARRFFMPF